MLGMASSRSSDLGERVLVDLDLATRIASLLAELLHLLDGEAAVVHEDHTVVAGELLFDRLLQLAVLASLGMYFPPSCAHVTHEQRLFAAPRARITRPGTGAEKAT